MANSPTIRNTMAISFEFADFFAMMLSPPVMPGAAAPGVQRLLLPVSFPVMPSAPISSITPPPPKEAYLMTGDTGVT